MEKSFIAIPTESIIRDHQEEYYDAIEKSNLSGESTIFIEFMLEIILESIISSVIDSVKSSVKSPSNTDDKILIFLKENPTITVKQIAEKLKLTQRAIEKQIAKLKKENKLQRKGSPRSGHWQIIDEKKV